MITKTGFYTDERTFWHTGGVQALILPIGGWVQPPAAAGFAESPDSKRRFLSLLHVSGLAAALDISSAEPADERDLLRVHGRSYLKAFKAASDAGGGDLSGSAPFGRGSYEIACLSTGLAMQAVADVVDGKVANAYALSRPPGHHCLADQSMGFCLLANIPIAIEAAKARFGIDRVAVVDWDVHHGNGTQAIYYERRDVLTISLHQDRCFPAGYSGTEDRGKGAGAGYNYNIPLLAGCGHDAYLYAFDRLVLPALDAFKPELIVVASGFDANLFDPLARMLLHSDSFRTMTARLKSAAAQYCGGRLVAVHEGGYSEAYVPFCGLAVVEELSDTRTEVTDPAIQIALAQQPGERSCAFQRQLIDEMASDFGLASPTLSTARR